MIYAFENQEKKSKQLLDNICQNNKINEIVTKISRHKINVDFPWFSKTGGYQPHSINITKPEATNEEVKNFQHTIKITISPRFGKNANCHTLIHELIHVWQDSLGLFLTPFHVKGVPMFTLDEKSHKTMTCFNEALAATEAIIASYCLKQKGLPESWRGAWYSPDWHRLAKQYEKDRKETNEDQAALNLYNNWFQSPLKEYYERRTSTPPKSPMTLNNVTNEALAALIPEQERPSYLKADKRAPLNNLKFGSALFNS